MLSPRGSASQTGRLGSEGSLTPYLLMERTRKQYCLPLTRSRAGKRGELTSVSRLASSQLFFPATDWIKSGRKIMLKKSTGAHLLFSFFKKKKKNMYSCSGRTGSWAKIKLPGVCRCFITRAVQCGSQGPQCSQKQVSPVFMSGT